MKEGYSSCFVPVYDTCGVLCVGCEKVKLWSHIYLNIISIRTQADITFEAFIFLKCSVKFFADFFFAKQM